MSDDTICFSVVVCRLQIRSQIANCAIPKRCSQSACREEEKARKCETSEPFSLTPFAAAAASAKNWKKKARLLEQRLAAREVEEEDEADAKRRKKKQQHEAKRKRKQKGMISISHCLAAWMLEK